MQGNALARAAMLPALIAVAVGVGWSLWPVSRTVRLHINGLPGWASTEVKLGRKVADMVEPGVFELTVRTGEHTLRIGGGLGEPCERCCFSLRQDTEIERSTSQLTLSATVPDCPTADYPTREFGLGEVTIDGQLIQLRRSILVGEPVSSALWAWGGDGGCGETTVACVTWLDVVRFANRLSMSEGLTPAYYHDEAHLFPYDERGGTVYWMREASGWRLPTEAEWLHAVNTAQAWEWTWDRFTIPYETVSRTQEEDGPRTARGPDRSARVAPSADLGFRLVRDVHQPTPKQARPPRERK